MQEIPTVVVQPLPEGIDQVCPAPYARPLHAPPHISKRLRAEGRGGTLNRSWMEKQANDAAAAHAVGTARRTPRGAHLLLRIERGLVNVF